MRHRLPATLLFAAACASPGAAPTPPATDAAARPATFANPLDLDYRFMPEAPSRREAADPTMVRWHGDYYLFASKSGGYWWSHDMRRWTLVVPDGYPLEEYAPSVAEIDGRLCYTAHKAKAVYTTSDPKAGHWTKVADLAEYADPELFQDDDGRVWLYHGSGLNGGISVVGLDQHDGWKVVRGPTKLMTANHLDHGWERSGPDNLGATMSEGFRIAPYVEGSWMTKHDGTYYLQYSAPGTVWKSYADGVYTSASPDTGFTYAPYSPFSYKPGGFIGSAGHASTFQDSAGHYWRVVTMVISVAHKFERRVGIVPAGFDARGVMRANTYLGDYPQYFPDERRAPLDSNLAGWMLLSGGHAATASSSLPDHAPALAVDEDVRTQWSAVSGGAGEWLMIDMGAVSRVRAVQVNLGEQGTTARDRAATTPARWLLERSIDGRRWTTLVDRRDATRDAPHEYVELARPVPARWVRLTSVRAAAGGLFAVRDLRVFGESPLAPPAAATGVTVARRADERDATIAWTRAAGARFYVVRYGLAPDALYASYQVGDVASLTLHSLNRGTAYWFTVDAVGEGGVARGGPPVRG